MPQDSRVDKIVTWIAMLLVAIVLSMVAYVFSQSSARVEAELATVRQSLKENVGQLSQEIAGLNVNVQSLTVSVAVLEGNAVAIEELRDNVSSQAQLDREERAELRGRLRDLELRVWGQSTPPNQP